ncbi:hypothetical protein Cni_G26347 [Canna indica]|uniref:Uncharacterized protein n=1 Tax=Canna indica TaxID=4628 RepID=A0AAQ3KZA0_9LILI|nr:hypothetical protein Cni_G26347 [Canna indica]
MEERYLDLVMVPLGLLLLGVYHCWLLFTILKYPDRTVIGLNAQVRRRWVQLMMADSIKNGVLAVQTIRNNIMASTVLATTAITLASLITVFVSASTTSSVFVYGNTSSVAYSIKYFAISLCFLLAFLCNVQSIRYYAHVSFLVTHPTSTSIVVVNDSSSVSEAHVTVEYVARSLNRGSYFWSLGLRAFYISFTLFLWIFGPIPMLASSVVMCCILFFLDTTTEITRALHLAWHHHHAKEDDITNTMSLVTKLMELIAAQTNVIERKEEQKQEDVTSMVVQLFVRVDNLADGRASFFAPYSDSTLTLHVRHATVVDALEKKLTLFAFHLALLEKSASGLGMLAFVWAIVLLLGGFAIMLEPKDFVFITIVLVTESTRIFSRSHELSW